MGTVGYEYGSVYHTIPVSIISEKSSRRPKPVETAFHLFTFVFLLLLIYYFSSQLKFQGV